MSQQWFFSSDGKTQQGPISAAQLHQLVASGQLRPEHFVRLHEMNHWVRAVEVPGLIVLPEAVAPVAPVELAAVEEVKPKPRAATARPRPAPDPFLGLVDSARKVVSELNPLPARPVRAERAEPVAPKRARRERPPLRERKAERFVETGTDVAEEFAACWNGLEDAGLPADELVYFCATQTTQEETLGNKVMGMLGAQTTVRTIHHLALFRREIVILHAPPQAKPQIVLRAPLDEIAWQVRRPTDIPQGVMTQALRLFSQPGEREAADLKRTAILTLRTGTGEKHLSLFRGDGFSRLRDRLEQVALAQVDALLGEARYHQAERLLAGIPGAETAVHERRSRLGTVASVVGYYQGGHPELPLAGEVVCRIDALGLELFSVATRQSVRIPYAQLHCVMAPRRGKFPAEYVAAIAAKRKAAQTALNAASIARYTPDVLVKMGAQASIIAARQQLAAAKLGEPWHNRLLLVARVAERWLKIVVDVTGAERQTTEQRAATFHAAVTAVAERFGVKQAPHTSAPVRRVPVAVCPHCRKALPRRSRRRNNLVAGLARADVKELWRLLGQLKGKKLLSGKQLGKFRQLISAHEPDEHDEETGAFPDMAELGVSNDNPTEDWEDENVADATDDLDLDVDDQNDEMDDGAEMNDVDELADMTAEDDLGALDDGDDSEYQHG